MFSKKNVLVLFVVALFAMATSAAFAGNTTQNVTVNISTISSIAVSGSVNMTISAATAGSAPTAVTDASTQILWSTNEATQKVIVVLDNSDPGGHSTTLKVQATSPGVGTPAAQVTLGGALPADLITGVGNSASSATLTYTASAPITTAAGTTDNYVIRFTVTA